MLHLTNPQSRIESEFIKEQFALYRDLTRITVSDSKTEYFSHHFFRNNIRNNGKLLSVMTNNLIFPSTKRLNKVLHHSITCSDELRLLEYIKSCPHKLTAFLDVLQIIEPQSPIELEYGGEQPHYIAI